MAHTKDVKGIFSKKIFRIDGVKGFLLVRNDGRILTSKLISENPETLASMMILSSLECNTIRSAMGFTHFGHLMLTVGDKETLFVFPMQTFFLGILRVSSEYDGQFVKQIKQVIYSITKGKPVQHS